MSDQTLYEEQLPKDIERFNADEFLATKGQIGVGGQGTVFVGSFGPHKNIVRKYWRSGEHNSRHKQEKEKEVTNMFQYSHHQNIVRFFGVLVSRDERPQVLGIVTEFMSNGDLGDALHNQKLLFNPGLDMYWIVQAGHALQYLHGKNLAHRDVKPQNMLLENGYRILKLCDFGLSKDYSVSERSVTFGMNGTNAYIAPEKLEGKENSEKNDHYLEIDVYAFSISIWEILTRSEPYGVVNSWYHQFNLIQKENKRPDISVIEAADVKATIERCWHGDPKERPKIGEIVGLFEGICGDFELRDDFAVKQQWKIRADVKEDEKIAEAIRIASTTLNGLKPPNVEPSPKEAVSSLQQMHKDIEALGDVSAISANSKEVDLFRGTYQEIGQIVTELMKEYSKRTVETIWSAKDLSRIKEAEDLHNGLHSNIVATAMSTLLDYCKIDWSPIDSWQEEVEQFAEKRKKNWGKIVDFMEAVKALRNDLELIERDLKKGDYAQVSRGITGLVGVFSLLEEQQRGEEHLYMECFNGEIIDPLEIPRSILGRIDQKLRELVTSYRNSIGGITSDLQGCHSLYRQLSEKTHEINGTSFTLLLADVAKERERLDQKWKAIQSLGKDLSEFGVADMDLRLHYDIATAEGLLSELQTLHQRLCQAHQTCKEIEELERRLPSYSLLEGGMGREPELEDRLSKLNAMEEMVLSRLPFSVQLKHFLEKRLDGTRRKAQALLEENDKIKGLLAKFTGKVQEHKDL